MRSMVSLLNAYTFKGSGSWDFLHRYKAPRPIDAATCLPIRRELWSQPPNQAISENVSALFRIMRCVRCFGPSP